MRYAKLDLDRIIPDIPMGQLSKPDCIKKLKDDISQAKMDDGNPLPGIFLLYMGPEEDRFPV